MKQIPLTQGQFAQVDDEDFEWLSQWKWYYHNGYAVKKAITVGGKRRTIWMHRLIAETPNDMDTDHKDRDKLNNRRANLRWCSTSQNQMNSNIRKDNKSGIKGVYQRADGKWRAQIRVNNKKLQLGLFDTAKDAARAYDEAALKFCGDFANINYK